MPLLFSCFILPLFVLAVNLLFTNISRVLYFLKFSKPFILAVFFFLLREMFLIVSSSTQPSQFLAVFLSSFFCSFSACQVDRGITAAGRQLMPRKLLDKALKSIIKKAAADYCPTVA